jgi:hypothetical protein
MTTLRIEEKVTIVRYVEVNEDAYPDVKTAQQAKEYELDRDLVDQLDGFSEALSYADFAKSLGDPNISYTGDYSIKVDIIE